MDMQSGLVSPTTFRRRKTSVDRAGEEGFINIDDAARRGAFRSGAIIFFIFFTYVIIGLVMFHHYLGWDLLEAIYFVTITFSTVGYGDLDADQTPEERIFTSFYLLIGLIAISSFLSVYLQIMTDQAEAMAKKRNRKMADDLANDKSQSLAKRFVQSMKRSSHELGRSISRTLSIGSTTGSMVDGQSNDMSAFQEEAKTGIFGRWSMSAATTNKDAAGGAEQMRHSEGLYDAYQKEKEGRNSPNRLSAVTEASMSLNEQSQSLRAGGKSGLTSSASALMQASIPAPIPDDDTEFVGADSSSSNNKNNNSNNNDADVIPTGGRGVVEQSLDTSLVDDTELTKQGLTDDDQLNLRNTLDLLRDRQSKHNAALHATIGHVEPEHHQSIEEIMMKTYDADIRAARNDAIISVLVIPVVIFIGCYTMMSIEGWAFDVAFYWACQTVTTVGYGDFPPNSRDGKLFTIFYLLFGLAWLANAVSKVVNYPMMLRARHVEDKVLQQFGGDLSEAMLHKIFHSEIYNRHPNLRVSQDEMSASEFILLLLEMMNKVDEKDIVLASRVFDRLDTNGDRCLSPEDMEFLKEEARKREEEEKEKQEEEERKAADARTFSVDGEDPSAANVLNVLTKMGRRLSTSFGHALSGKGRTYSDSTPGSSAPSTPRGNNLSRVESGGSSGLQSFLESDLGSPQNSGNINIQSLSAAHSSGSSPEGGAGADNPIHDGSGSTLRVPLNS
jgi:hypothetical protein